MISGGKTVGGANVVPTVADLVRWVSGYGTSSAVGSLRSAASGAVDTFVKGVMGLAPKSGNATGISKLFANSAQDLFCGNDRCEAVVNLVERLFASPETKIRDMACEALGLVAKSAKRNFCE